MRAYARSLSTLHDPHVLSPDKEGWGQKIVLNKSVYPSLKFMTPLAERWNPAFRPPWSALVSLYHRMWNTSRPILLECSPPEILHTDELIREFSPYGPVLFLMLVRSPCNARNPLRQINNTGYEHALARRYGRRLFALRFEDLCVDEQMAGVNEAMNAWLPGLLISEPGAMPLSGHGKRNMTVPQFCRENAVPSWPLFTRVLFNAEGQGEADRVQADMEAFGYTHAVVRNGGERVHDK